MQQLYGNIFLHLFYPFRIEERIRQATGCLLLQFYLGVAVSSLQERCIAMTGQFCNRLFIYATVQQCGDEIVTQSMQMKMVSP